MTVPTLLEIERAIARSLLTGDDAAAPYILAEGLLPQARLAIYRNTFAEKATTALRLSYPAVCRLVGAEFFEGAARLYLEKEPPGRADLDAYGEGLGDFLAGFPPARGLPYLGDVARLEWAVARAHHAPDVEPIDVEALAAIAPEERHRLAFRPHPAVGLLAADYPVDAIWRAVLAQDEAAMAAIDLGEGPVRLLIERRETGVEVMRCDDPTWRVAAALFASLPLMAAIDAVPEAEAALLLAEHLTAGHFIAFELAELGSEVPS